MSADGAPVEVLNDWPVVLYRGARDNRPKPRRWSMADLRRWLCCPRPWPGAKLDVHAWSPVAMVEGAPRAARNVRSVSMLVLDCDAGDDLRTLERLGDEYIRIGHTSWSHTPAHPKARLVFPFASPCPVEMWPRVWGAAARWAAAHGVTVDAAAKDPSRLYFMFYGPMGGPEYVPGGCVWLEEASAWMYGDASPDAPPVAGALPHRRRSWLSWARLAMQYPEPEPEPQVYAAAATGALEPTEDEQEERRRRFARGIIRHRCAQIQAHGEGGRNVRVFAAARMAGSLAAGGWLVLAEAAADIEGAGLASGLSARETARAIRNGIAQGTADGPFEIDSQMTERVR